MLLSNSLGGTLGNPVFSLKGNQGQDWKPAEVEYITRGNIQVTSESPLYL